MFKIDNSLLEQIKKAIVPQKVIPADGIYTAGCFGCSSECVSSCRGGCWGNCIGGCYGSCSGSAMSGSSR